MIYLAFFSWVSFINSPGNISLNILNSVRTMQFYVFIPAVH